MARVNFTELQSKLRQAQERVQNELNVLDVSQEKLVCSARRSISEIEEASCQLKHYYVAQHFLLQLSCNDCSLLKSFLVDEAEKNSDKGNYYKSFQNNIMCKDKRDCSSHNREEKLKGLIENCRAKGVFQDFSYVLAHSLIPSLYGLFIFEEDVKDFIRFLCGVEHMEKDEVVILFSAVLFITPAFLNFARSVFCPIIDRIKDQNCKIKSLCDVQQCLLDIVECWLGRINECPGFIWELLRTIEHSELCFKVLRENVFRLLVLLPERFLGIGYCDTFVPCDKSSIDVFKHWLTGESDFSVGVNRLVDRMRDDTLNIPLSSLLNRNIKRFCEAAFFYKFFDNIDLSVWEKGSVRKDYLEREKCYAVYKVNFEKNYPNIAFDRERTISYDECQKALRELVKHGPIIPESGTKEDYADIREMIEHLLVESANPELTSRQRMYFEMWSVSGSKMQESVVDFCNRLGPAHPEESAKLVSEKRFYRGWQEYWTRIRMIVGEAPQSLHRKILKRFIAVPSEDEIRSWLVHPSEVTVNFGQYGYRMPLVDVHLATEMISFSRFRAANPLLCDADESVNDYFARAAEELADQNVEVRQKVRDQVKRLAFCDVFSDRLRCAFERNCSPWMKFREISDLLMDMCGIWPEGEDCGMEAFHAWLMFVRPPYMVSVLGFCRDYVFSKRNSFALEKKISSAPVPPGFENMNSKCQYAETRLSLISVPFSQTCADCIVPHVDLGAWYIGNSQLSIKIVTLPIRNNGLVTEFTLQVLSTVTGMTTEDLKRVEFARFIVPVPASHRSAVEKGYAFMVRLDRDLMHDNTSEVDLALCCYDSSKTPRFKTVSDWQGKIINVYKSGGKDGDSQDIIFDGERCEGFREAFFEAIQKKMNPK
jgi:hypothetical protein